MGKGEEVARGKQALYRQYRSASFDEVIGQEHITELLKSAVKNGSVSHAYLFTGPKGTGKTSVARILAFAANGIPYSHSSQHLDIIEIDAASNRRIDDIRDLREKVHIAPTSAPYKVYIIDEVHMLTGESFNALLKTLEEPPAHVIFILATTELNKVPATIVSRTQRFNFRPIARKKVVDHLASIAKREKIKIDNSALELIAEHGGGSFRDSISLLDQLGGLNQTITSELVQSILGRAGASQISSLIEALEKTDSNAVKQIIEDMVGAGISPTTLSEQLVHTILQKDGLPNSWYDLVDRLMEIPKAHFPQLLLTSQLLKIARKPIQENVTHQAVEKSEAKTEQTFTETPTDKKPAPKTKEPTRVVTDPVEAKPVAKPEKLVTTVAGEFNWDKILETANKNKAPIYRILSRATVSYDNNKLTLRFQYALHSKKLEQPTYRTQLSQLIDDVCGLNPEIVIEVGGQNTPEDDATRQVADIMGGGEIIGV